MLTKDHIHPNDTVWVGLKSQGNRRRRVVWRWINRKKLNLRSKGFRALNKDQLFRANDALPEPEGRSARCGTVVNNGKALLAEPCERKYQYICVFAMPDDQKVKERMNRAIRRRERLRERTKHSCFGIIEENNSNGTSAQLYQADIALSPEQKRALEEGENIVAAGAESFSNSVNDFLKNATSYSEAREVIHRHNMQYRRRRRRNVIAQQYWQFYLWPNGVVPVLFDTYYSAYSRSRVEQAMQDMMSRTCINFQIKTPTTIDSSSPHLKIKDLGSCYSYVGRQYSPGQDVSLAWGCVQKIGTIQHELMHALGFWHEQARTDRDNFVTVHYDVIRPGYEANFEKYTSDYLSMIGMPYDYSSILHYPRKSFSLTGNEDTITPKNPENVEIGLRDEMSPVDVAEINIMYDCKLPIHGGWTDFGPWSECSKTCGGGSRTRSRSCSYPPPQFNGRNCEGAAVETENCKEDPCPMDITYVWGGCWEDSGILEPDLLMSLEEPGVPYLQGDWDSRLESVLNCGKQAKYEGYNSFALKYGGKCFAVGPSDEYDAQGPAAGCSEHGKGTTESIDVYHMGTRTDGRWGRWSVYSNCTESCGGGTQTRTRTCTNPKPTDGGKVCDGDSSESISCNDQPCPIDGGWSEWGPWSNCSGGCGDNGFRTRTRKCNNPPPQHGGEGCPDSPLDEPEPCTNAPCTTTPAPTTTTTTPAPTTTTTTPAPATTTTTPAPTTTTTTPTPTTTGVGLPFETVNVTDLIGEASIQLPLEYRNGQQLSQTENLLVAESGVQTVSGRQGNGVLLENHSYAKGGADLDMCMNDPDTCTDGFTISFWMKQTLQQRAHGARPETILTFGVEAEEAETPRNGLGVAVYIRRDGMLKVLVRTNTKQYTVDYAERVFDQERWHHITVQWHPDTGLTLYYKGVLVNTHKDGGDLDSDRKTVYDHFMLGRPLQCFDHFFEGYLDEIYMWERTLSDAEVYGLYSSVPARREDCSHNADYDVTAQQCSCRSGFSGDGRYCQRNTVLDPADLTAGAPLYYWPMNKFQDRSVEGNGPLVRESHMTVSLGIQNNAVVFNGRRDYLDAGDFSNRCFHNPDACSEGFSIAFWLKYMGRGGRKNYILSTGAQPDPRQSMTSTGLSLFVDGLTCHAYVHTANRLYHTYFVMPRLRWVHVTFRYKKTDPEKGLYVYVDGVPVGINSHGVSSSPSPATSSRFLIGQPNSVWVYNGRFLMDNLAMWEASLSAADVGKLVNASLPEQTPPRT